MYQLDYILRNFKNATSYVECILHMVALMWSAMSKFHISVLIKPFVLLFDDVSHFQKKQEKNSSIWACESVWEQTGNAAGLQKLCLHSKFFPLHYVVFVYSINCSELLTVYVNTKKKKKKKKTLSEFDSKAVNIPVIKRRWKTMIRNRSNRIPYPSQDIIRERNTNNWGGLK